MKKFTKKKLPKIFIFFGEILNVIFMVIVCELHIHYYVIDVIEYVCV